MFSNLWKKKSGPAVKKQTTFGTLPPIADKYKEDTPYFLPSNDEEEDTARRKTYDVSSDSGSGSSESQPTFFLPQNTRSKFFVPQNTQSTIPVSSTHTNEYDISSDSSDGAGSDDTAVNDNQRKRAKFIVHEEEEEEKEVETQVEKDKYKDKDKDKDKETETEDLKPHPFSPLPSQTRTKENQVQSAVPVPVPTATTNNDHTSQDIITADRLSNPSKTPRRSLPPMSEQELKALFAKLDHDGNSFLSPLDLEKVLMKEGFDATEKDVDRMIELMDQDGDGQLDFGKFLFHAQRLMNV